MIEPEITEEIINYISGKELFDTIIRLKHSTLVDKDKLLKCCYKRARELNKGRFGVWEHAIVEVNHMPTPQYSYSTELLPVLGYPCNFIYSKDGNSVVIINPKTNGAYMVGVGEVTEKQARSILGG